MISCAAAALPLTRWCAAAVLLLGCGISHAAQVGVDAPEALGGGRWALPVWLETLPGDSISGLQCEVLLPPAYTFSGVESGGAAAAAGKQAAAAKVSAGRIRVLVAGLNQTVLNSGYVAYVLVASNTVTDAPGATVAGVVLSSPTGQRVPVRIPPRPGTGSGAVNPPPAQEESPEGEVVEQPEAPEPAPAEPVDNDDKVVDDPVDNGGTNTGSGSSLGGFPMGLDDTLSGGMPGDSERTTATESRPSANTPASGRTAIPKTSGGSVAQPGPAYGPSFRPPPSANTGQRAANATVQQNAASPRTPAFRGAAAAIPPAEGGFYDMPDETASETTPEDSGISGPLAMANPMLAPEMPGQMPGAGGSRSVVPQRSGKVALFALGLAGAFVAVVALVLARRGRWLKVR